MNFYRLESRKKLDKKRFLKENTFISLSPFSLRKSTKNRVPYMAPIHASARLRIVVIHHSE